MKKFFIPKLLLLTLFTISLVISGCTITPAVKAPNKVTTGENTGKVATSTQAVKPKPVAAPIDNSVTAPAASASKPGNNACAVTIYGSDACGRCSSAKSYLTSIGVAFEFKDIKKDSSANMEKSEKVQKFGGLPGNSIPIIDVCGDLIRGFDKNQLNALLTKHGLIGNADAPAKVTTTAPVEPAASDKASNVTVYGTSSCSWCKKAKSYLQSKDVAFADKDVGKDKAANQEMFDKAKAKGLSPKGVPVIDVCGDMVLGFDQAKIDELLKKHGLTSCSGGSCSTTENPGD
ncbi:MAG: hypothetical protein KKB51_09400 [Candidatus Riflebacteria bacterium]|nr:hypothetical protein [Candidatus Riflebacteria bacterium]